MPVPPPHHFVTPKLVKVYSRMTVGTYYRSFYDTRVVRYLGSLQPKPNLPPVVTSVVAASGQVTVTFNTAVVLTGAATTPLGWSISAPVGMVAPVAITGVLLEGTEVILTTSEQTGSATYTLNFPEGLIFSTPGGLGFTGPFEQGFLGVATPTPIISAISVDAQTLDILFARAVQPAGALNPANYLLTPSVTVLSVTQTSPNGFRLTTAPQSTGQMYTLTASNIYDLAFNPI